MASTAGRPKHVHRGGAYTYRKGNNVEENLARTPRKEDEIIQNEKTYKDFEYLSNLIYNQSKTPK